MIVFRAGQGLTGGVLIPLAFTIVLTTLPPAKQPIGLALFSITATFAPSIGPTIGGWLTDNFSWQYNFYLNIIPGILLVAMVWYAIEPQPLQIGEVIMWSGLPQLFLIPFVPRLMKYFDVRWMAATGFSLLAVSCFMNSHMTQYTDINELRWSQLVRAIGQPLMILPLTSIATAGIKKEQAGSASGLFNMMRNLGGSMGIAALSTLLTRREQFHSNRIGESVSLYNAQTRQQIEQLTQILINRGTEASVAYN